MSIALITLQNFAAEKLSIMYIDNINNRFGIDYLLTNEMRFIKDSKIKATTRQWLHQRFPNLLGSF